ncbi:response regulator transcription factor [Sphingomonas faeni]|uniref:response regulator transcription factor n=1 Tax=Sphingomonas faeni TaxID=185950 RepID=UPI00278A2E7A|nr:response regulator [Sphingomonas faeni]MDQ0839308.1 two-component system response regulator FixJ [Sphingomonas faeni]
MTPLTRIVAIIDDDHHVRSATSSLIRSLGLHTLTFASAEDFLEADSVDVTCIVSDVQMGGMSGLDLLANLSRHGSGPATIIMTAHATDHIRERAESLGAVAVLEKPFPAETLVEALSGVFGPL